MKRLFWDKSNDSFHLRDNPEWCNITIDKDNKMTIEYNNSFKKRVLIKTFKKTTTAMNVARILYDKLSCHNRGKIEDFNINLPGDNWFINE